MEKENIQTPSNEGTEKETIAPQDDSGEVEAENQTELEPSKPVVDYEKKFSESAREAQVLNQRIKQLERKLEFKEETPTEKDMRSIYPNWDDLDNPTRELAQKNIALERRVNQVQSTISQIQEEKEWNENLNRFIEKAELTGKYPELDKGEFRKYAEKPTHKGIDLDVLVKAFLYKADETMKDKPKKDSLLERGSGGPKTLGKPKKGYTSEELGLLRKNDFKKWKEVISKGNVNYDDL